GFGGFGGFGGRGFGGFWGGNPFSPFAAPGAAPPTNPTKDRIRVGADPATKTLLGRASPLDMIPIRQLLGKGLDKPDDSNAAIKTHILPLKNANANEVANIIKDVFSESMSAEARSTRVGGFVGIALAGQRSQNGQARVTLSLGVDDRTNSLIVA